MSCLEPQIHFPSGPARWVALGAHLYGHFILARQPYLRQGSSFEKKKSETIELINLKPSLKCSHMSCLEPKILFPPGPAHS